MFKSRLTGTFIIGDTFEGMATLPDNSIQVIFADLPYGRTRAAWDNVIDPGALWLEYRRLLAPGGVVVLTSDGGVFGARMVMSNPEWFRYKAVWQKNKATGGVNARRLPLNDHEDLLVFSVLDDHGFEKQDDFQEILVYYPSAPDYTPVMTEGHEPQNIAYRKARGQGIYGLQSEHVSKTAGSTKRYPKRVIDFIPIINNDDPDKFHPTQKPPALTEYYARMYGKPGATLLDNTAGSCMSMWGAFNAGMNCVCIEQDEGFVMSGMATLQREFGLTHNFVLQRTGQQERSAA